MIVTLIGQTFVSADVPPLERNREQPKQAPDNSPLPEQPKRFGCRLFGAANISDSLFATTPNANSATINQNPTQIFADVRPFDNFHETKAIIKNTIIAGVVVLVIIIFSGVGLFYVVKRSRRKHESPMSEETKDAIETTENVESSEQKQ
jgi:hypothetical protein